MYAIIGAAVTYFSINLQSPTAADRKLHLRNRAADAAVRMPLKRPRIKTNQCNLMS